MEKTDLNDVAKRSASERLYKAMTLEKMGPSEAARKLNILPQYVTMSKQEKYWPKMPKSAWDRILLWCNSGETLHHFKIPVGEVTLEEKKKVELPPREIKREMPRENVTAPLAVNKLISSPGQDFTDTARLKVCLDIEINLVINGQKIKL